MNLEPVTAAESVELMAPTDADRASALARWLAGRGAADADEAALTEASRLSRVFSSVDGPMFDPVAFGELVEFIEELPF